MVSITITSCTIEIGGDNIKQNFTTLDTPDIIFTNNQVSWTEVPNAFFYELTFNGEVVKNAYSPYDIDSEEQNGEYIVRAIPNSKLNRYLASDISEVLSVSYVTPTNLETPVLTFDNNTISWDENNDAFKYTVFKNDVEVLQTAETNYIIVDASADGEYKVLAEPNADSRVWLISEKSLGLSVSYVTPMNLDKPVATYNNNVLTWNAVPNAVSYKVYRNDSEVLITEELSYTMTSTANNGVYTIVALKSPNSNIHKDSDKSDPVNVAYVSTNP
ncbi:hypothetical protein ACFLRU_04955 [Bacteroidota bacterium]